MPADEQRRRVVPVIRRLAAEAGVPVSVDTADAAVAAAALEAGATVVNDITAGRGDPEMMPLVARAGAGYVFMHMQGTPATMQVDPRYDDVVAEVGAFLAERRDGRPRRRHRPRPAGGRPRARVRQDRRPQPRPCSPGSAR